MKHTNRFRTHTASRALCAGLVTLALALTVGACSDDENGSTTTAAVDATEPSTETTAPATTEVEVPVTEAPETSVPTSEPDTTAAADTTDAPTTDAPTSTAAPTTTTASDELQALPGMASIEVTVAGTDPTRPTYSWPAPAGAASYQLAAQTADGAPLWGWTGTETTVIHGGTERARNVEGPTLVGPSRVRVYAFDAAGQLMAVSAWTAVPVG